MFLALATELSNSGSSLDKLVARLFHQGPVDRVRLQALAAQLLGRPSQVLASAYVELEQS
jgi:hypothetical protein